MRRTALLTAAAVLLLAACSETISAGQRVNPGDLPGEVRKVTVDGMPCLVWTWHQDGGLNEDPQDYSGITCDWRDR